MREAERRKRNLLNLPSIENWARNNRPRFDDTFFALSNFDKHPPTFGLGDVKKLCADFAMSKLSAGEASARAEAIKHPAVRAAAMQVLPEFQRYLRRSPIEGLKAFDGFRLPYPIGPKPGGGTLAIPIAPTFVGIRNGQLVPVFLIPWASLPFDDFQKCLVSSILKDSLLTLQEFIGCDAEILAFPKIEDDSQRYECSWGVTSYARMDREDLNKQFGIFGRALTDVITEIDQEEVVE